VKHRVGSVMGSSIVAWNSTRNCSKLVWVNSKKNCSCIEGKSWPNTTLIKKCVQYL
jgi:hypothetical protein